MDFCLLRTKGPKLLGEGVLIEKLIGFWCWTALQITKVEYRVQPD